MDLIKNATRFSKLLNGNKYKPGTTTLEFTHAEQVGEMLQRINAPDYIVCAGLCHNITAEITITNNDLRKIISAPGVIALNSFNDIANKKFDSLSMFEKMMLLTDLTSNTRIILDELNKQGDELWDNIKITKSDFLLRYKNMLDAFNKMKKTPLIESEFDHAEIFNIISELKDNIDKIEGFVRNRTLPDVISEKEYLPMPEIIKEGKYYTAYDDEGNALTRAQSYQEAKQDLYDDGYR